MTVRPNYRDIIVLVLIASTLLMSLFFYNDYRETLRREKDYRSNTTVQLSRYIVSAVEAVDAFVTAITGSFGEVPGEDLLTFQARKSLSFDALAGRLDQISSILLIGPDGTVLWGHTSQNLVGINLADRAYFQRARNRQGSGPVIGQPILSRGSGVRLTPLAWPIRDPSGQFSGVLAISLNPDFFEQFMGDVDEDDNVIVEVLTRDGHIVFAHPDLPGFSDSVDATEQMLSQIGPDREPHVLEGTVGGRRDTWLVSSRPTSYPNLNVLIAVPFKAVLKPWIRRTVSTATAASLLGGLALYGLFLARRRETALVAASEKARHATIAARRAGRNFETIFDNVADGIVLLDEDYKLERINPAAMRLLNATDRQDAQNRVVHVLTSHLPETEPLGSSVFRVAHPDAQSSHEVLECSLSTVSIDGIHLLICVMRDATQRVRFESMKNDFISTVNHELRTPLTSISGALSLITSGFAAGIPDQPRHLIAIAKRNADRLLGIVNDILTIQKIDNDSMDYRDDVLDIDDLIRDCVESNTGYAVGFGVELEIATPLHSASVIGDHDRLIQVLSNLVSNAIKFSPAGGTVSIASEERDGEVAIAVTDRGPGVPPSFRPRLFERFAQSDGPRGDVPRGTGLGLAISQKIATHHGGRLSIWTRTADEVGENEVAGTTARLHLPVAPAPAEERLEFSAA